MKKFRLSITLISLVLLCSIFLNLAGCSVKIEAAELMAGITPNKVNTPEGISDGNTDVTDFAVRLFKQSNEEGKNTLISPLSVLCALSMTANGANGETREQMEDVLGMTVEELNLYLYSYLISLPQGEKYKLNVANSIWFRDDDERLTIKQDFLQTNADYYSADVYKAPFNKQTLNDINNWVKSATDNMISNILNKIPEDAVMYLINALAFEAEWTEIYEKGEVRDGKFTKEDGTKQKVEFMYSSEGKYLEDENATGFIKYYNGRKYAFAALLPNEGISVAEYLDTLDGASVAAMLSNAKNVTVNTAIPKFETEYDIEMSGILGAMGMTDAFNGSIADFTGLGTSSEGNIYIGKVLHKTYIQVGEKGTKAGAATAVEMNDGDAYITEGEIKQVYLDRPFVYMLIDCENNIPFFIGTLMDIEK